MKYGKTKISILIVVERVVISTIVILLEINNQSIMHGNMKQTIQTTMNDTEKSCIFCA